MSLQASKSVSHINLVTSTPKWDETYIAEPSRYQIPGLPERPKVIRALHAGFVNSETLSDIGYRNSLASTSYSDIDSTGSCSPVLTSSSSSSWCVFDFDFINTSVDSVLPAADSIIDGVSSIAEEQCTTQDISDSVSAADLSCTASDSSSSEESKAFSDVIDYTADDSYNCRTRKLHQCMDKLKQRLDAIRARDHQLKTKFQQLQQEKKFLDSSILSELPFTCRNTSSSLDIPYTEKDSLMQNKTAKSPNTPNLRTYYRAGFRCTEC